MLLVSSLWGVIACRQSTPSVPLVHPSGGTKTNDKSVRSLPPAGMVRVSGQKIQEDANTFHWKWTIIGDRQWRNSKGDRRLLGSKGGMFSVILTNSYLLNDTDQIAGTNGYTYEVTITSSASGKGKTDLDYAYSLQNINSKGVIIKSSGGLERNVKRIAANRAVQVLLSEEKTLSLPLDIPVLEIAGQEAGGKRYHETFRIKAAK